jgi:hypothetical protein
MAIGESVSGGLNGRHPLRKITHRAVGVPPQDCRIIIPRTRLPLRGKLRPARPPRIAGLQWRQGAPAWTTGPRLPSSFLPCLPITWESLSILPMSPPRHQIRGSIAASISACHAEGPGSRPERRSRRADRSVVPLRLELEFQAPQSMRELQRPMGHPRNRCV